MIEIIKYNENYFLNLIHLIKNEGDDWLDYTSYDKQNIFKENLNNSIVYLLFKDSTLIGYIRGIKDIGYAIYICDLLVDKNHRGNQYGFLLMNRIKSDNQDLSVYVMSDVDKYYHTLKLDKIGSIFLV
jgi:GNAT superfamily N-acetyltransferase